MRRYKKVSPLTTEAREDLERITRESPDFIHRRRAQAILFSHQGITIPQMEKLLEVDRDTISRWIDLFEASGPEGLKPLPRAGRPPIYTDEEVLRFRAWVDEEPRQIRQARIQLQQATGKTSSLSTLKRVLKKTGVPVASLSAIPEKPA